MVRRLSPRALITLMLAAMASLIAGSATASAAATPSLRGAHPVLGPLTATDIARLSAGATERSIVLFKNQHQDVPARPQTAGQRISANDADQAPVVNELNQLHAQGVKRFSVVNAVAATISPAEAQRLKTDPAVQAVVADQTVQLTQPDNGGSSANGAAAQVAGSDPSQPICPTSPSGYLLEPEALQVMNVQNQPGDTTPAAHDLADGHGVKVGIIADGLDVNDPDLMRNGKSIVYDYENFGGNGNSGVTDGRESFLDSGAIASQGTQTYDLSKFVNPAHPTPVSPCNIKIEGVAPGASLAVMNALPLGGAFDSTIIQAIDWAVTVDGVDVLNESFGGSPAPDEQNDPVAIADDNAVAAGVTVVASTGDSGPTNTIGSPASNPGIIAVGGSTTYRVYQQATRYGVQLGSGGWEDNNITALSSSGTTQFGPRTVDVVAPGDRGWELCSTNIAEYTGCADFDNGNIGQPIWAAGGTSLSSPLVSGTAALVIQAYESTHGGAAPSPALVKQIIVSSAQDLGAPADHQGAGLVDSLKAVQLAMSIHDTNGSPSPIGHTVLSSATSLIATGAPGAHQSFSVNVTNESSGSQTVTPSVVALGTDNLSDDVGTVTLGTSPTFIDDRGRPSSYQTHTFTVPPGADYLNGDIIWQAQAEQGSVVFETVFDPQGRVAAYSLLNEASGHGHIEVRNPQAGTWKAVIWTVLSAGPYSGKVRFEYYTQQFAAAGSVSPPLRTLAAGDTGSFTVSVTAPDHPGDTSYNLRLAASGGAPDGSIPILLRTLVPINHSGGSFHATLTGGATLGQQAAYQFDVPSGKSVLNISMKLQDSNYPLLGYLVSPDGEPHDVQSTEVVDIFNNFHGVGNTMQFFQQTPAPGRWTLVIWLAQFLPPLAAIPGTRLHEPFSVDIDFTPLDAAFSGLPNSPSIVIPAGHTVTASLNVTNSGDQFKEFFADARLDQRELQGLAVFNSPNSLPLSLSAQPIALVPASSDALFMVGQGTIPILMDMSAQGGDPDVEGIQLPGNLDLTEIASPELAPGAWIALPEPQGPFGPTGVPAGSSVVVSAAVDTNVVNPDITASSGNVWAALGLNPGSPYSPLDLNPGGSGAISLSITPTEPAGTVVHGFVELEAFNAFTNAADEIVTVPYTYTVG